MNKIIWLKSYRFTQNCCTLQCITGMVWIFQFVYLTTASISFSCQVIKKTLNPDWPTFEISSNQLSQGNPDVNLKVRLAPTRPHCLHTHSSQSVHAFRGEMFLCFVFIVCVLQILVAWQGLRMSSVACHWENSQCLWSSRRKCLHLTQFLHTRTHTLHTLTHVLLGDLLWLGCWWQPWPDWCIHHQPSRDQRSLSVCEEGGTPTHTPRLPPLRVIGVRVLAV